MFFVPIFTIFRIFSIIRTIFAFDFCYYSCLRCLGASYPEQLAQLEDMVILVRGKLSNNARTTVGALTVIDVHARDVMIKLAYEKVAEK